MTNSLHWMLNSILLHPKQEVLHLSNRYLNEMKIGDVTVLKRMQLDSDMHIEAYGTIEHKTTQSICINWQKHLKSKMWCDYVRYGEVWKVTGQN